MSDKTKFHVYSGGAAGAFLSLGLLGHTSNGVIRDTLHLSYTEYFVLGGLIGAFFGWLKGRSEASKRFLLPLSPEYH